MTQLGFGDLLADAHEVNTQRKFDRATAYLPGTMAEALPFYRAMIDRHHAAMLAADVEQAMAIRNEAHKLARKLNGGDSGILATPESPGCVLEREAAAPEGTIPLWGQAGDFIVAVDTMRVRIELKGMFGIGSTSCLFPGFYARAVDMDRPFLSETGFRSFLGLYGDPVPGLTPEAFVRAVIAAHVRRELKGRPRPIEPHYR
jgi:hypothetical protein